LGRVLRRHVPAGQTLQLDDLEAEG
jgi:hypothetical protein